MPAEKFSWSPGAGVRSLGQLFMHVASAYYLYASMAFGGEHTFLETSVIMTDDLQTHLGQLIAYSRKIGAKPPWTR